MAVGPLPMNCAHMCRVLQKGNMVGTMEMRGANLSVQYKSTVSLSLV